LRKDEVRTALDEKMRVIGHENITANRNATRFAGPRESDESFVDFCIRQHLSAMMRIERYEIERRVVTRKQLLEARGSLRHFQM
jgi:hypothetical protein